jgi:hypothetical protein
MNLRAFIGSSSESLNIANAIKHSLSGEIDCTVWTDRFFKLSRTTIETLSTEVDNFDVGIFVFGEDDALSSRGASFSVTRDNVLFEYGLFCGRLGLQRAFVVRAKSKALKWLSDLEGFTVAQYDEDVAKTSPDVAVKKACDQIRNELRSFTPKPGIFVEEKWRRLGLDFWTYGGSEISSTVTDEEGIQFYSDYDIGLRFPQLDNLASTARYCVLRVMSPLGAGGGRFYISLLANNERVFLSVAHSHTKEGWGVPENEFMLRLHHIEPDTYQTLVVDLKTLEPFIGSGPIVTGFRLRPGLKLSHFGVCDALPIWLRDAVVLSADRAPLVTIEHPFPGAIVGQEEVLHGTFRNLGNANDIQVLVFSPDNNWYSQGPVTVTNRQWSRKAFFGNRDHGAGREFKLAVLAGIGEGIESPTKKLPAALAKSIVKVTRGS